MLHRIKVYASILPDEGATILLQYTSGRRRVYEGTPYRLLALSHRLTRLLNRNRDTILCRPFYDAQPGYVVFRKELRT